MEETKGMREGCMEGIEEKEVIRVGWREEGNEGQIKQFLG